MIPQIPLPVSIVTMASRNIIYIYILLNLKIKEICVFLETRRARFISHLKL